MMKNNKDDYSPSLTISLRQLTNEEINFLESNGCSAEDWESIKVEDDLDLSKIRNVGFGQNVSIKKDTCLENIYYVSNCEIGREVIIENVNRIFFEEGATCGVGTYANVLDETGTRPVVLYPGLNSQIATLMAREPRWLKNVLCDNISDFLEDKEPRHAIGDKAKIRDCGKICNVSIGEGVNIDGASSLINGTIINNVAGSKCLAYVGSGVYAENFIIEDGEVDSDAIIINCYVGQGVKIARGFSAHDCVFFANSTLENGEACSVLAGPYTVSMHKSTLLIGIQTSFMNAGSATNQSNHMYKLGPVHCGIFERGVKTASGAYIMLGAKIGAFSLLMGSHKTHPDSSEFPFSYLFGDERGATVVVPGAMLRSCGLLRDEKKWPTRDRRLKRRIPMHDRIIFDVLNPMTVETMLQAIDTISQLLLQQTDDDLFLRYKGMKFSRAALERAKYLYTLAISKYLSAYLENGELPGIEKDVEMSMEWKDLGGQLLPVNFIEEALNSDTIENANDILNRALERYSELQLQWIALRFRNKWDMIKDRISYEADAFDRLVEEDRIEYMENLNKENKMLSLL